MWMGSSPGTYDLYAGLLGTNRSCTMPLPTDGRRVYVTLWGLVAGTWVQLLAYPYRAATPMKAQMLRPGVGSALTGSRATFTWDAGVGVTFYALWVGSAPASHDLYAGWEWGNSRTLTLPTDGRTIHVTLWSCISGVWQFNAYTYKAFGP
jgi:hypothetical protein